MLDSWMGRGQKGSDAQDKVGLGSIRRPVIGLALGGGAARGFAHIGIIKTLIAHGILPNVVVGTSIGAVNRGCSWITGFGLLIFGAATAAFGAAGGGGGGGGGPLAGSTKNACTVPRAGSGSSL